MSKQEKDLTYEQMRELERKARDRYVPRRERKPKAKPKPSRLDWRSIVGAEDQR